MTDRKRITLEDLMAVTGAGPRKARRLVREGRLPGFVDGTLYVCSPGEFQRWIDGDWEPPVPRKPVQLHSVRREDAS